MKIARRITLSIAAAILLIMALHAYLLVQREVVLFDADLARSVNLKRALKASIETVWRQHGDAEAQRLVEQAIAGALKGVRVRWTWLDAPPGDPRHLDLPPEQLAELRGGTRVIFFRKDVGADPRRYTYVPASIEGARPAVFEFVESIRHEHRFIRASRLQIELATVGMLLACGAAVYGLGLWYVGRPIQRLRDKVRQVAAGSFDGPLALKQHDEIGELAREIDLMSTQLAEAQRQLAVQTESREAALEQLRHTDRLTTIGQLASGVAHELGTPLSVIAGRAEMIVSGESTGERAVASARAIVEQTDQMTRLIRTLLDFSRRQKPRFGPLSVRAICARTVDTLGALTRRRRVTVELHASNDPAWVSADEHQIVQALANLIVNAMQAMPDGGRIVVTLASRRARPPGESAREGEFVCVMVEDKGAGIAREDLPRLFEPFFTTKDPGEGTGLGLSVANGIVRDHGGWIEVESELGQGSCFAVFLPAAAQAGSPPRKAA